MTQPFAFLQVTGCLRETPGRIDALQSREMKMCKECCERPGRPKGKPEECSAEQIKACHGETKKHPCEPDTQGKKRKNQGLVIPE